MKEKISLNKIIALPRYDKGVWIMIIIRFISMLGYAIYGPYLMLYFNQTRGLNLTLTGLMMAISSIGGALSQIYGGTFTDRFGRRFTLITFLSINLVISAIITLLIATAVPLWILALVYVVSGFVWGMTQPAMMAVITDLTPKSNLTEAYGVLQLIINVAWIIGPPLGGYMFSHLSYTYLIGVTIITSALGLILSVAFLKDSYKGNKEVTGLSVFPLIKKDLALTTYTVLAMLVFIVYVQIVDIYPVFTVEQLKFTTAQYGLLLTFNAVLLVIFQYPITRWVNTRLGDKNALIYGAALFTIGYFSLSWITSVALSFIYMIVVTIAELLFIPSITSIVGKLAAPEECGRYMGLLGTGTGLGIAIGPLLGGALYDASHGNALLLWGPLAAIAFIAGLGFLRWFSVYRKRLY